MIYSVKTLIDQGKNNSEIARYLGIDRKTVRNLRRKINTESIKPPVINRNCILTPYKEEISDYLKDDLNFT